MLLFMVKKGSSPKTYPSKSNDVPINVGMLYGVRDELKSDIKGVRDELKSDIKGVRDELKSDIKGVRHELKSDITRFESSLKSEIHRIGVLMEEQNARNSVVLDGLSALIYRQDRLENEVSEIRRIISPLVK